MLFGLMRALTLAKQMGALGKNRFGVSRMATPPMANPTVVTPDSGQDMNKFAALNPFQPSAPVPSPRGGFGGLSGAMNNAAQIAFNELRNRRQAGFDQPPQPSQFQPQPQGGGFGGLTRAMNGALRIVFNELQKRRQAGFNQPMVGGWRSEPFQNYQPYGGFGGNMFAMGVNPLRALLLGKYRRNW